MYLIPENKGILEKSQYSRAYGNLKGPNPYINEKCIPKSDPPKIISKIEPLKLYPYFNTLKR